MRLGILLTFGMGWLAPANADTATPAIRDARWASCADALEAARKTLSTEYSLFADVEVVMRADGVGLEFEDGWCMHHTSGRVAIEPARGRAHGWRHRAMEFGYTVERRARRLRASITYFDHNESESSGGVEGLGAALLDAFKPALDRCLGP
jgi:hypothetical protein